MLGHDITVIGAWAGGVEALPRLIGSLPAHLPAAVFVVLHIPEESAGLLLQVIRRRAALPVYHSRDGEEFRPGHVYVAPPDRHLRIDGSHVREAYGPKENRRRPAIDRLFRTEAWSL